MDNELNQLLLDNNNDNNDNNINDINNNNDNNDFNFNANILLQRQQNGNLQNISWTSIFIYLAIYIFICYSEFISLSNSIINLIHNTKTLPYDIIDKCIKYPSLTQIYFTIFYIFIFTGIFLFFIIFEIHNEDFLILIFDSFVNFIFYFLGPLLTGFSGLGIIFYYKVCYLCLGNDPNNVIFDGYTFLLLLIWLFIGINILLGYNSLQTFKFFQDSLSFKDEGSYFLGKLFWKIANWRRFNNNNI